MDVLSSSGIVLEESQSQCLDRCVVLDGGRGAYSRVFQYLVMAFLRHRTAMKRTGCCNVLSAVTDCTKRKRKDQNRSINICFFFGGGG